MLEAPREGRKGGKFTLDDFKSQLLTIKQLGPLQKVVGTIPGMSGLAAEMADFDPEEDLKRLFGIIDSMTSAERENPKMATYKSRRQRIAAGAGVETREINELVKQFDFMAQMKVEKFQKIQVGSKIRGSGFENSGPS